ncbi:sugar kinase (plasmid) [Paroceanicella profunda]|uniref:Sugar kinase n=1 Tax=Paroceanicella profunda TaxID=2579971 RepID=A0A5B8G626_9RHOB|nr:sugar kinase [Paroceanicella profunda]
MPSVACIGEAMLELSGETGAEPLRLTNAFAGDTLNTAVYLARLGLGEVAYVTLLGQDAVSDSMLRFMAAEGLSTEHVGRHPDRLPGIYMIENEPDGERHFRYWRDAAAARRLFTGEAGPRPEDLSSYGLIYLSGISVAILSEEARAALLAFLPGYRAGGGRFAFDSNYRPRLWSSAAEAREVLARFWAEADIALPSIDDEIALHGGGEAGVLARFGALTGAEVLIKRGADGPLALTGGQVQALAPFPRAERVVDTTGAGDSFNAGYLAARLSGADIATSAARAHALSMEVIGHRGAILPRRSPQPA